MQGNLVMCRRKSSKFALIFIIAVILAIPALVVISAANL
jgi:hypothetical protein